jgi:hypothetical protein
VESMGDASDLIPRLDEVFKISGVPTYTFVPPTGFEAIKASLRTPGRGIVIEGPSGIGKSTAITRAVGEVGLGDSTVRLTARLPADVEYISALPEMNGFGVVVVDDFHRLSDPLRESLADLLKVLADTENSSSKLIVVGINQAGESLMAHAPDLANRLDVFKFEVEPPTRIQRLIALGEDALNVDIAARDAVVDAAQGSFYIAQLLCFQLCLGAGLHDRSNERIEVNTSFSAVRKEVMARQDARFGQAIRRFARGTKFRPSGRGPYLHVLHWLRNSDDWSISLSDELARHPAQRISVSQVVEKGYLENLVNSEGMPELLHFDPTTRVLSVEDPHLVFYLRHLDWPQFVRDVGFTNFGVEAEYDVALSFAGEDREYAEKLHDYLSDEDLAVFYDLAEQARILTRDVEAYLEPIYESKARYVVAVLGEKYGIKRWTLFESDAFRARVERGEVVPIWSTTVPPSAFDETRRIGGLSFDPLGDLDVQAREAARAIASMVEERDRESRSPLTMPEAELPSASDDRAPES